MRARILVVLILVAAAVSGVFDWRSRDQGPPPPLPPGRRPGTTEWLAEVHARTTATEAAAFLVEVVMTVEGHEPVVFRERGAFDVPRRRRWLTVELPDAEGGPPPHIVVIDDHVWISPGHLAPTAGLEPRQWVESSLRLLERFGHHRWRDGLPETGRLLRDLVPRAIGDSVVVGADELHGERTTHVRPWIDDPDLPDPAAPGPLDVWVDDELRLRRVELVAKTPDRPRSVTLRVELFAYGEPVALRPPDPAAVVADEALAATIMARLPMMVSR